MDLAAHYAAYLAVLNERRFDDLAGFVHDDLTYNDEPITRRQYSAIIEDDVATIPDLAYTIVALVVRDDDVAARLLFDCTPVAEFRGRAPTGRRITFTEHVFYRFREGRIAHVWSLIDNDAIRAQLSTGAEAGQT